MMVCVVCGLKVEEFKGLRELVCDFFGFLVFQIFRCVI